jgi:hypothetical protein
MLICSLFLDKSSRRQNVHLVIISIIRRTAMLAASCIAHTAARCCLLSHSLWIRIAELAALALCNCTHKPLLCSKITIHEEFIFAVYRAHIYIYIYILLDTA